MYMLALELEALTILEIIFFQCGSSGSHPASMSRTPWTQQGIHDLTTYGAERGDREVTANTEETGPSCGDGGLQVQQGRQAGREFTGPPGGTSYTGAPELSIKHIDSAVSQVLTQPLATSVNIGEFLNSLSFSFLIGRTGIRMPTHRSSWGFGTTICQILVRVSETQ